jgi:hypothetical protein
MFVDRIADMAKRPTRVPFTFMVDPELMDGLKRLQARTGVAMAEALRRAIRAFLIDAGELPPSSKSAPPQKKRRS